MDRSEFTDIGRLYTNRPPEELVNAFVGTQDSWRVNIDEFTRAQWMWSNRPRMRLYTFAEEHRFVSFLIFTLATLALIPVTPIFVWVSIFASYPLFLLWGARRLSRWEICYHHALLRVIRR